MTTLYGGLASGIPNQNLRKPIVDDVIYLTKPDEAPFTALMVGLRKLQTSGPKFEWYTKDQRPVSTALNMAGDATATDTQLVVDDASIYVPGDVIRVVVTATGALGEQLLVRDVNTDSNVVGVARGQGNTSAGAILDDTVLRRVGNSQPENGDLAIPTAQDAVGWYNYSQIFELTTSYTRTSTYTAMLADMANKEIWKRRDEKTREFKREMEAAMLFGDRYRRNAGQENESRFTGGLQFWIDQSIAAGVDNTEAVAGGGALTEAVFRSFLSNKVFVYGGSEKFVLCSKAAINVMNGLQDSKVRLENMETTFGLNIMRYESPWGIVNFIRHDMMNFGVYANSMLFFDPDHLEIQHLGPTMTEFDSDVGERGVKKFQDRWLSEAGLKCIVPYSLAMLTNIVSAA